MKRENVHVHVQFHVQFHVQVLLVHLQAHLPVHRPPTKKTTTTTPKKPTTTRKTTRKPSQKPETCEAAIRGCAVAYESDDCTSGWKLPVGEEEMKFKVFTSTFKYRNDIDVIGVRANCTFIGYEDSDFNGDQMILPAEPFDRWVVLADTPDFEHMDEEIESLKCFCEGHHN